MTHPKTSQATFGFGSVRTDNPKLAHPIRCRGAGNYGAGSLKPGRLQNGSNHGQNARGCRYGFRTDKQPLYLPHIGVLCIY